MVVLRRHLSLSNTIQNTLQFRVVVKDSNCLRGLRLRRLTKLVSVRNRVRIRIRTSKGGYG